MSDKTLLYLEINFFVHVAWKRLQTKSQNKTSNYLFCQLSLFFLLKRKSCTTWDGIGDLDPLIKEIYCIRNFTSRCILVAPKITTYLAWSLTDVSTRSSKRLQSLLPWFVILREKKRNMTLIYHDNPVLGFPAIFSKSWQRDHNLS